MQLPPALIQSIRHREKRPGLREEIIKKGRHLPVDQIAVVRTFPGGGGTLPSVVVVFLDKGGKVISALNGEAGQELGQDSSTEEIAQGVTNETADIVKKVSKISSEQQADAQHSYDSRFIGFEQTLGITVGQYGAAVHSWSIPYQGKD